jgi:MFS superfamily sulfate permease-like transporter
MEKSTKLTLPKDGWAGLKENFTTDVLSGFVVFLLAMPLSLGIAKASEFPPIMGLLTAIIGGVVVSMIAGSRLTIKGPAAGLIVVVAGAVNEFGGGEIGWRFALGAMVAAGIVQILFGVFKLGKLADIFPLSAIHGMLAAIGIIIIAKQIPVLLDVDPALYKGLSIFSMIGAIPTFFANDGLPTYRACLCTASYWKFCGECEIQCGFWRNCHDWHIYQIYYHVCLSRFFGVAAYGKSHRHGRSIQAQV